ncbi:hypothetical protein ElyMa_003343000 [Elysia marginata]|uniref:Uncharacterized protein n=1 Tax=Elysia marginata TaxID=1093978 RepID=A0AAV4JI97_9GAST|nr:hypothetical protein ElyMa_003343000 [Elysia marginata]
MLFVRVDSVKERHRGSNFVEIIAKFTTHTGAAVGSARLNWELRRRNNYCEIWKLKINCSKTVYRRIAKKRTNNNNGYQSKKRIKNNSSNNSNNNNNSNNRNSRNNSINTTTAKQSKDMNKTNSRWIYIISSPDRSLKMDALFSLTFDLFLY